MTMNQTRIVRLYLWWLANSSDCQTKQFVHFFVLCGRFGDRAIVTPPVAIPSLDDGLDLL